MESTKHNLTFVIPAKNEEKRIKYVLDCLNGWGNILLLNDGSSDRTVEIARQYPDLIVHDIESSFGVTVYFGINI